MDVPSPCPCPFCAAPPFFASDDFISHFVETHRSPLFSVPDLEGTDEQKILAGLIILFEKYFPTERKINIKLAALVGSDSTRVKRIKENVSFQNLLTQSRMLQEEPRKPIPILPSPEVINLETCDPTAVSTTDLSKDVSAIFDDIKDISTILRDKSDYHSRRFNLSFF